MNVRNTSVNYFTVPIFSHYTLEWAYWLLKKLKIISYQLVKICSSS